MLTDMDKKKLRHFGYIYNKFVVANNGVPVNLMAAEMFCHPRTIKNWFSKGELGERLQSNFVLLNNEIVYRRSNHMTELTKQALQDVSKRKITPQIYQDLKDFRDGFNQLIDCNKPVTKRFVSVVDMARYIKRSPRTVIRWFEDKNTRSKYLLKDYFYSRSCIFSRSDYMEIILKNTKNTGD